MQNENNKIVKISQLSSEKFLTNGGAGVEGKEAVKVYKWDGTAVKNALHDAVKDFNTLRISASWMVV